MPSGDGFAVLGFLGPVSGNRGDDGIAPEADKVCDERAGRGKVRKTGISFGNFVFLGLRRDSGIRSYGDADSYLCDENGVWS
jgi:hypothetical protein